jgi:hypothetical protein
VANEGKSPPDSSSMALHEELLQMLFNNILDLEMIAGPVRHHHSAIVRMLPSWQA